MISFSLRRWVNWLLLASRLRIDSWKSIYGSKPTSAPKSWKNNKKGLIVFLFAITQISKPHYPIKLQFIASISLWNSTAPPFLKTIQFRESVQQNSFWLIKLNINNKLRQIHINTKFALKLMEFSTKNGLD